MKMLPKRSKGDKSFPLYLGRTIPRVRMYSQKEEVYLVHGPVGLLGEEVLDKLADEERRK